VGSEAKPGSMRHTDSYPGSGPSMAVATA